jgi:hypothetical protein
MTISMYAASVPVFKQLLIGLDNTVAKAETHVGDQKIEANAFLCGRLFPDMFPFARQIIIATELAKGCAARLADIEIPQFSECEVTFETLRRRIAASLAFLESLAPEQIDGSEEREICFSIGTTQLRYVGQEYLLHSTLPQLIFHITVAYAILRKGGVVIGKKDFLGKYK